MCVKHRKAWAFECVWQKISVCSVVDVGRSCNMELSSEDSMYIYTNMIILYILIHVTSIGVDLKMLGHDWEWHWKWHCNMVFKLVSFCDYLDRNIKIINLILSNVAISYLWLKLDGCFQNSTTNTTFRVKMWDWKSKLLCLRGNHLT